MATDEGNPIPESFAAESQAIPETLSGTTVTSTAAGPRRQPEKRDMEFAPLPSQAFGHMGTVFSPYDMRAMSNSLPDYSHSSFVQPQFQQSMQQAPIRMDHQYQYGPSAPQFAGQIAGQYLMQTQQPHQHLQRAYSGYESNVSGSPPNSLNRAQFFPPQQQQYGYGTAMQPSSHIAFGGQRTGNFVGDPNRGPAQYHVPRLEINSQQQGSFVGQTPSRDIPVVRRNSSNSSLQGSNTLRGPPRKPKQSGHALWVGNLPPGTQIIDLKDHFARDATEDIESVFLISKSNCAFVNYKTEESCAAAMSRFHDSRFRGVRLVCRLRRGSNSATTPSSAPDTTQDKAISVDGDKSLEKEITEQNSTPSFPTTMEKLAKEKFFIIKSLTLDDLERSLNTGIWATQAHNEENLNLAFKTAENVYLVFSANKSGEYFGYARMESLIGTDLPQNVESETPADPAPRSPPTTHAASDVPMKIPTSATATAPRGHIIDDSSRGTIFWEAEGGALTPSSAIDGASGESAETSGEESASRSTASQQSSFGKPFKISWQSTERLPFYRTRGLRNPWNANREVKIARDGTELEPTVGRKLIGMFEQQAQINQAARTSGPPAHFTYPQPIAQYSTAMMGQPQYGYAQGPGAPYGHPF